MFFRRRRILPNPVLRHPSKGEIPPGYRPVTFAYFNPDTNHTMVMMPEYLQDLSPFHARQLLQIWDLEIRAYMHQLPDLADLAKGSDSGPKPTATILPFFPRKR